MGMERDFGLEQYNTLAKGMVESNNVHVEGQPLSVEMDLKESQRSQLEETFPFMMCAPSGDVTAETTDESREPEPTESGDETQPTSSPELAEVSVISADYTAFKHFLKWLIIAITAVIICVAMATLIDPVFPETPGESSIVFTEDEMEMLQASMFSEEDMEFRYSPWWLASGLPVVFDPHYFSH